MSCEGRGVFYLKEIWGAPKFKTVSDLGIRTLENALSPLGGS